jgi:hypothetical protein
MIAQPRPQRSSKLFPFNGTDYHVTCSENLVSTNVDRT